MQELVLKEIFALSDRPIFKGGTALEIAYGSGRFSEDLDFDIDVEDAAIIDRALENIDSKIGIENDWESEITRSLNMHVFKLYFHSQALNARIPVKIDAVFEKPELEPKKKLINVSGSAVTLSVMDEREILAEKVNAIMDPKRNEPRDLYDLRFLLGIGTQVDFHLIYIKSERKAFGRHPKYSLKRFTERVDSLGGKWEELRPYLRSLPEFKKVKEDVLSTFKLLG